MPEFSVLVGADYDKIVAHSENVLSKQKSETRLKVQNPYGNGESAKKIVEILKQCLQRLKLYNWLRSRYLIRPL